MGRVCASGQRRTHRRLNVPDYDDLVGEILSSSGVPTRRQRADLERELRSHLEDMREHGEVHSRFGNPADISGAFFRVYRTQRGMIAAAVCAAYNVVSFAVVFGMLWSLQLIVDSLDMPLTRADVLDDATWAVRGLALLSLSYGWLFFGERLFNKHAFEKSAALLLLALACGWTVAIGIPALHEDLVNISIAIFAAVIFRAFEVRGIRLAWLLGPAIPICVVWLVTGPPFMGDTHVNDLGMSLLVTVTFTICCPLVSLCARGLDRLGSTV